MDTVTGTVVRNFTEQKRPFYYCLLMSNNSIPVMELLSTRHTASWICNMLEYFNSEVRECNSGRNVKPYAVITDFSYAMIYAVLFAYNKMSIVAYLRTCYTILEGKCMRATIRFTTFINICCAHMIKAVSKRLVRVEKEKKIRQATLVMFSRLQRCSTLQVLISNFYLVKC